MSQRFSDAELAAEWWRVDADVTQIGEWNSTFDPSWSRVDNRDEYRHAEIHAIIHRFATLPHEHPENLVKPFTKENE